MNKKELNELKELLEIRINTYKKDGKYSTGYKNDRDLGISQLVLAWVKLNDHILGKILSNK